MMELNKLYLMDCMDGMKTFPDNYFDLAIVDPPYFKNGGSPEYYRSGLGTSKHKPIVDTWEIPEQPYFDELFRVSKDQIIWGVNYYAKYIPHQSRIVWDKMSDNTPFSQCDIASWSKGIKIYQFRYKWNGMIQQDMKNKENRIHPTQKPIQLYKWLLKNYAQPDFKIIDTHVGSGSSIIAFEDYGCDWIGFEIDEDYHKAATKRIEQHKQQPRMQL